MYAVPVIFIAQISLSNRFLLSACHVSDTLLGPGTMIVNETIPACLVHITKKGKKQWTHKYIPLCQVVMSDIEKNSTK